MEFNGVVCFNNFFIILVSKYTKYLKKTHLHREIFCFSTDIEQCISSDVVRRYAPIFIRLLVFFCLSALQLKFLHAQCGQSITQNIPDNDTLLINITVSGVQNNQLSHPDQGVCGVALRFNHQFVGDLTMELISPAGQSVMLIGPSGASGITQFTIWEIFMTQCGFPASPDIGFSDNWNNQQPWGIFNLYNGTYYPNQGCLENFNTGPVNGTWQLRIIDNQQFDTGNLFYFFLIFCDEDGIDCEECEVAAGSIENENNIFCQGSEDLLLDLTINYPDSLPGPRYNTTIAIFNQDTLMQYKNDFDYRSFLPGSYLLCPLSYFTPDSLFLPDVGIGFQNWLGFLDESIHCVAYSNDCWELIIQNSEETLFLAEEICKGDSLNLFGMTFFETGIYDFTIEEGVCEIQVQLDLKVIDFQLNILANETSLGCDGQPLTLRAGYSAEIIPEIIIWNRVGEGLTPTGDSTVVRVNQIGEYVLIVQSGFCTDSVSIFISPDDSVPDLNILGGTINCRAADVNITAVTNALSPIFDWSSEENFSIINDGIINVTTSGWYYLTLTDGDCLVQDSVFIPVDTIPIQFSLISGTWACDTESLPIIFDGPANEIVVWGWETLDGAQVSDPLLLEPSALSPGVYILQAQGNNRCQVYDTLIIEDRSYVIEVLPDEFILGCGQNSVNLNIETNSLGTVSYNWNGPGLINDSSPSPEVFSPGNYTLILTDDLGCSGSQIITVIQNTDPPVLMVSPRFIDCSSGLANLSIDNPSDEFSYQWFDPEFLSDEETLEVSIPGLYTVVVTASNNCTSQEFVLVEKGPEYPEVNIDITHIDCVTDTARIELVPATGVSIEWNTTGMLNGSFDLTGIAIVAGNYMLFAENTNENCRDSFLIEITDNRYTPDITLSSMALGCLVDSVMIGLQSSFGVSEVNWTGPDFNSTETEPTVFTPGWYFVEFVDSNFCSTLDSVEVGFIGGIDDLRITEDAVLTCERTQVELVPQSSVVLSVFSWVLEGNEISTQEVLTTSVPGEYKLIVNNDLGCIDSITTLVSIDTISPEIIIDVEGDISCIRDSALLSSVYLGTAPVVRWILPAGDTSAIDNIYAFQEGTYIGIVTDLNGCSSRDSVFINDLRDFVEFTTEETHISCDNLGRIDISVNDNYRDIIWKSPGGPLPTGELSPIIEVPGVYEAILISIGGCESTLSVEILADTLPPMIDTRLAPTLTCQNPEQTAGVLFDGMLREIVWTSPLGEVITTDTFLTSQTGLYTGFFTGTNGCILLDSVEVSSNIRFPEVSLFEDTLNCLINRLNLNFESNEDLSEVFWTGPGGVVFTQSTPLINTGGWYYIYATNGIGCTSTDSVFIYTDQSGPDISINESFYLPCNGEGVNLFVESDYVISGYRWLDNMGWESFQESPNLSTPGQIYVFAFGVNGCSSRDSTRIIEDERRAFLDVVHDSLFCNMPFAEAFHPDPDEDANYFWLDILGNPINAQELQTNIPGTYALVGLTANACADTLFFEIEDFRVFPEIDIVLLDTFKCENTEVRLGLLFNDSADYTYNVEWSSIDGSILTNINSDTVLVGSSGSYILKLTNALNDCSTNDTIFIQYAGNSDLLVSFDVFSPLCENGNDGFFEIIEIENAFGSLIVEITDNTGQIMSPQELPAGIFSVVFQDSIGCQYFQSFSLDDGNSFEVLILGRDEINLGETSFYDFSADLSEDSILIIRWFVDGMMICEDCDNIEISPHMDVEIVLELINLNLCSFFDTINVRVNDDLELIFPNSIKPGVSAPNDRFFVPEFPNVKEVKKLIIYNRWGNIVFENANINPGYSEDGWDGSIFGQQSNPGVFVFIVELLLNNGETKFYTGDITVVR
jgi:subtilisin-like proprotein convertase family protein